jgi:DNA-binding NarL/FixJ family response regulator
MVGARARDAGDVVGAEMIRVVIIEDHPVFRQGLAQAVESTENMELLFAVSSVEEFDQKVPRPDVAILDLGLPGVRGAAAVDWLASKGIAVLVVSAESKQREVLDAIAAGARGYLTKNAEPDEVVRAVTLIAGGEMYVSPTLASFFIRDARGDPSSALALTAREREILSLLASGETDADIAQQLFISVRTVRSHLDRIRDKTGRRRRADLTRLALEKGLVTEDRTD